MHPFNKPVHELELADIVALIENETPESTTLDYKRDLYGSSDKEREEFLCDVSAFANTVGGYLVVGMREEDKIAKEITPVTIENLDTLESRFQNWLSTSVDPPLRGVEFQPVDAGDGKTVLVIKIPRSISRPHAVRRKKNYWQFHGRHSTGNHPYEMDELRRAILQSETLAVKMRNFRNDRLAQISVGETPVPLPKGAKAVLHVIPVSSLELGRRYNLGVVLLQDVPPIAGGANSRRMNFDGCVTYLDCSDRQCSPGFTQVFHNGIIESASASFFRNEKRRVSLNYLEDKLIDAVRQYFTMFGKLGVQFPVWLCLSLVDVRNYMQQEPESPFDEPHPIDRAELIIPEIEVEDASIPAERILKPAFDSIWNACGHDGSLNYDKDGNRLLKGR